MMNTEYLEELFAQKVGNLEIPPPEDGWRRIEKDLNLRRRMAKRFWLAAASLALLLSGLASLVYIETNVVADSDGTISLMEETSQQNEEQPLAMNHSDNDSAAGVQVTASVAKKMMPVQKKEHVMDMQHVTQNSIAVSGTGQEADSLSNILEYNDSWDEIADMRPIKARKIGVLSDKIAELKLEIPENKTEKPAVIATAAPSVPAHYDAAYMHELNISANTKQSSRKHWEIAGQFAPMQSYRIVSNVPDGLQKANFDDAESPLLSYSGGVLLAYRVFNRMSIQTGIFYSQMGQSINNVTPVANMNVAVSSNNPYAKNVLKTSSGNVTVVSNLKSEINTDYSSYFNPESKSAYSNSAPLVSNSSSAKYKLIEKVDYLEIPLLMRYRIIDRKLHFYVLGGMSANVLIETNVFIDNGTKAVKGGMLLMARPVNYSSTFGMGVGYQIMENMSIGFEPSFKYYLQSYTTNSQIDSNPYSLGLFTGILYRF